MLMDVQAGSGWGLALSWSPSGQSFSLPKHLYSGSADMPDTHMA